MRKLAAVALSFSTVGIFQASSFADDQVQLAEQLLESAFACPTPAESFNEADQPIKGITRARFSGGMTAHA
jgi:hypothetical protein